MHKPHPLLCLNPSHICTSSAQTSATPASESFSCLHKTCTNLTHSCVWILLRQASNMHKTQPLLHLNPSHAQTCKSITHSRVWILLRHASILHKPHPLVRLNPSHKSIKPAQTSPTLASESFSDKHQTCTKHNHSCVWILLMHKHAKASPTPVSESFSYTHQFCTNLIRSCVWILLIKASNLHKPRPLLRLNPSQTSIKHAQNTTTLASESFSCTNMRKHHPLLRLNLYHACIKPAQTSPPPASESLSCVHQTCTNLTHSCVWILLIPAPALHKHQPLLRRNPSHACIKPAQTSPTPASESFSYKHRTCANFPHSCVWILLIHASNLHKPHPLLRLNPSQACIKPAQTSPTPAPESFSYTHQTRPNLTNSCVLILLIQASNLHKPPPLLRLNPSHTRIKPAQNSPTPASESFSRKLLTCTNPPNPASESFS